VENTVKLWSAAIGREISRRFAMANPRNEKESDDESPHSKGWGGKLAIVVILGVALVMASYAWWHRYQQGRRSLEFWGHEPALLISQSRQVELLRLRPTDEPADDGANERLNIAGQTFTVIQRKDVSRARGLLHARDALVEDASFLWDQPRGDCQGGWEFALRFSDGQHQSTVALDFACRRVRLMEGEQEAAVVELTAKGLREFVDRQYEEQKND
jgi:hypothetical protein